MTDAPAPTSVLEIALALDGEAAEAVCALFAEHGGGAVVQTRVGPDGAVTDHRVVTYIPADDAHARARIEIGLWHLGCIHPLPEALVRTLTEADWTQAWKAHFRPLPIGRRFLVTPSWIEPEAAADALLLRLDPGMAFGTGLHPTTQLCLKALEDLARPGDIVLDVGTGSGILAIGALLLGASRAVGVDIDPVAVRTALDNAGRNGVHLEAHSGGIDAAPDAPYRLVLANLLAGILVDLAHDLHARTVPGGHCIASGLLADQAPEVSTALVRAGFQPPATRALGDWVALVAHRPTLD